MNKKTYYFNKGEDMIQLAIKIQSDMHWGAVFFDELEKDYVPYSYLWEYIAARKEEGYTRIIISATDEVEFVK